MAQSNNTQADVVIIGAGISGLCTAYHLKKRNENLRYVVLEAKGQSSILLVSDNEKHL